MKNKRNIEEEIEHTLNSLDGLQPAEANPYLLTRIQQRLRKQQALRVHENWLFKTALILIIFIALNVFSYTKFSNNAKAEATSDTGIKAFAKEYGLQTTGDNI